MIKRIAGGIGTLILLALLGYCVVQFNPTLLMTPFDRHQFVACMAGRGGCNMIPEYFQSGQLQSVVVAAMAKQGYSHALLKGSPQFTDEFYKRGGSMSFVCSYELDVLAKFDGAGHLVDMGGYTGTACP